MLDLLITKLAGPPGNSTVRTSGPAVKLIPAFILPAPHSTCTWTAWSVVHSINSYSSSHLLATVTTQWLDGAGEVTVHKCLAAQWLSCQWQCSHHAAGSCERWLCTRSLSSPCVVTVASRWLIELGVFLCTENHSLYGITPCKYQMIYETLSRGGGALVFEVGYHPRKKIHVIRVVFQDKAMYAHTSFRSAKMGKIGKKGVFLVILTSFGKDMTDKLRKTHAKTRIYM